MGMTNAHKNRLTRNMRIALKAEYVNTPEDVVKWFAEHQVLGADGEPVTRADIIRWASRYRIRAPWKRKSPKMRKTQNLLGAPVSAEIKVGHSTAMLLCSLILGLALGFGAALILRKHFRGPLWPIGIHGIPGHLNGRANS